MVSPRTLWTAVAIVLLALVVRLAAGVAWQARLPAEQRFFFADSESYWELGQHIAAGEPYAFRSPDARVFRTPGYPLLLAALFRLCGPDPPVLYARALSAVCGAITVAGIIGWGYWLFDDPRAGLIAGAITAVYPGAVGMSVFVLSEAAFCPLLIAQLWTWGASLRASRSRDRTWLAVAAGVVTGLASLVRPSWLFFAPCVWLASILFSHERRAHFQSGAIVMACSILTLLPWWIRNARVTGHFVPTTLQAGASLYDGLNPRATGASDMRFVPEFEAQLRQADAQAAETPADSFEYRLDRLLTRESLAWAGAHPARVLQLAATKLARLWNIWPNEPALRNWPLRLLTLLSYLPLLLAGCVGAWRFRARGWEFALAWMPALYLTLLHTIFVSSIRYREPAMLALTVLAAGALAQVLGSPKQLAARAKAEGASAA